MNREDYKHIATLLKMYCAPDWPAHCITFSNKEKDLKEVELLNKEIDKYHDGQVDMFNQIVKFIETYPERLELIDKIAKKLYENDD